MATQIMSKGIIKKIPIIWQPTDRQLRQFGVTAFVALPLLTWFWSGGNRTIVIGAAVVGGLIAVLGWFCPRALKPLFIALSLLAFPIGFLVQEICLGLMFFLVFVTVGLFFRWRGWDPMQRKFDATVPTYWQKKKRPRDVASHYRRW